tara:strand:+ start:225 stop:1409 length:1185 start_codon:yes stop_codon:yes gene_type:complete
MEYKLAASSWGKEEVQAMHNVIESGSHSMGENVKKFENEFAAYIGTKYAIMVNSGSSANLIGFHALKLLKFKDADHQIKVAVPAVSWSTTYFPLQQLGFKLVFIDVDINNFNMDLGMLEEVAQNHELDFVCGVSLLGNPMDFDRLESICRDNNILYVEDNCESLGAEYDGKKTGGFGLFGSFSFFFSHHLVTMEGGMVCTDNSELADYARSLRAHGWLREVDKNSNLHALLADVSDFEKKFRFVVPGYNLRPIEMEAAIGLVQLQKAESFFEFRRANYHKIREIISKYEDLHLQDAYDKATWFGFGILLVNKLEGKRDILVKCFEKYNIEARPLLAGNFLKNPVIEHIDHIVPYECKNADYIDENGVMLGNYNRDMTNELELLSNCLEEFFQSL